MIDHNGPIAVIDSGLGGISVLKELLQLMPNENYLYYGDSANAPYGTKTTEQVFEIMMHNARFVMDRGAKALVVACNTATSAAILPLRKEYSHMPVIGVEPALKPAALYAHNKYENQKGSVVVMATPITLRETKYLALRTQYEEMVHVWELPCPKLVEFVEKGMLYHQDVVDYLSHCYEAVPFEQIDAVVLGCTHFPFAKESIEKVLGENVKLFDGGEGTARQTKRKLVEAGLYREHEEPEIEIVNSSGSYELLARSWEFLER